MSELFEVWSGTPCIYDGKLSCNSVSLTLGATVKILKIIDAIIKASKMRLNPTSTGIAAGNSENGTNGIATGTKIGTRT